MLWNKERWEREMGGVAENKRGMEKNWDCVWGGFKLLGLGFWHLATWKKGLHSGPLFDFMHIYAVVCVHTRAQSQSCWRKGICPCLSLSRFLPSQLIAKWPWIYRSYRWAAEGIFTRFPAFMAWPNCAGRAFIGFVSAAGAAIGEK